MNQNLISMNQEEVTPLNVHITLEQIRECLIFPWLCKGGGLPCIIFECRIQNDSVFCNELSMSPVYLSFP